MESERREDGSGQGAEVKGGEQEWRRRASGPAAESLEFQGKDGIGWTRERYGPPATTAAYWWHAARACSRAQTTPRGVLQGGYGGRGATCSERSMEDSTPTTVLDERNSLCASTRSYPCREQPIGSQGKQPDNRLYRNKGPSGRGDSRGKSACARRLGRSAASPHGVEVGASGVGMNVGMSVGE